MLSLKKKEKNIYTYTVMDVLINLMGESFHKVYVYQVIMLYTLNILQFYLSIRPQQS